jgi:hypothetical protein
MVVGGVEGGAGVSSLLLASIPPNEEVLCCDCVCVCAGVCLCVFVK